MSTKVVNAFVSDIGKHVFTQNERIATLERENATLRAQVEVYEELRWFAAWAWFDLSSTYPLLWDGMYRCANELDRLRAIEEADDE